MQLGEALSLLSHTGHPDVMNTIEYVAIQSSLVGNIKKVFSL